MTGKRSAQGALAMILEKRDALEVEAFSEHEDHVSVNSEDQTKICRVGRINQHEHVFIWALTFL